MFGGRTRLGAAEGLVRILPGFADRHLHCSGMFDAANYFKAYHHHHQHHQLIFLDKISILTKLINMKKCKLR